MPCGVRACAFFIAYRFLFPVLRQTLFETGLPHDTVQCSFADYAIQSFDELTLGTILPEAYTGRPVKPRVRLICHGDEDLLLEGVDYTVTYSDNVEKGTGRVTVTSLIEELPGTLTGIFTICGAEALNGHPRAYILTKNSSRPVEIGPEY